MLQCSSPPDSQFCRSLLRTVAVEPSKCKVLGGWRDLDRSIEFGSSPREVRGPARACKSQSEGSIGFLVEGSF